MNSAYVVCPRRKLGNGAFRASGAPVEVTLQMLRPYFEKPLVEAADELGLSATAIKKACRTFGIPKWPFRTLAAKSSRNRVAVEEMTRRLDEAIIPGAAAPHFPMETTNVITESSETLPLAKFVQESQWSAPSQPATVPETVDEASMEPVLSEDDGFDEFSRCSSSSTHTDFTDEDDSFDAFQRAASSPLEVLDSVAESLEAQVEPCPSKFQALDVNLFSTLACDGLETSPLERDAFEFELFNAQAFVDLCVNKLPCASASFEKSFERLEADMMLQ
eukprot:CAMPEP_0196722448 /NCGR_PEP_ID=MMETSP1091-20130531/4810_1 /TAXON_ID=302021 /ORGANISM="Rhodomonas sp., Strain CCMP768" /LENGTH=275 /DNA_ID=CAMNT_0042064153 /DNA_START=15 /DNA_END=840 /DNA_ORIENTATION=-